MFLCKNPSLYGFFYASWAGRNCKKQCAITLISRLENISVCLSSHSPPWYGKGRCIILNLCDSAWKNELVMITPSSSTDLPPDLLDSCLDCSDDKSVFLLNRLTFSGSGKRSRLQKMWPFWWFLHHLEKEWCFRCKTLHSPRLLLGAIRPGLSSALHPACQALGGITMFRLFLVAWEGQLTLLWLGSQYHRQVTWLIFLRNNLWFSILIWSEPALLKARYGKAGEGCLHIISLPERSVWLDVWWEFSFRVPSSEMLSFFKWQPLN